jgi:hypothetical protein
LCDEESTVKEQDDKFSDYKAAIEYALTETGDEYEGMAFLRCYMRHDLRKWPDFIEKRKSDQKIS